MAPYVLFADSSCDLPESLMHEWEIHYSSLSFLFDDSDRIYKNYDMPAREFYGKIRAGHNATTSAVNSADFEEAFPLISEDLLRHANCAVWYDADSVAAHSPKCMTYDF